MTLLIIEDEQEAVERLKMFLTRIEAEKQDSMRIVNVLDSVKDAVQWFALNAAPDLVLMDIHLADGLSFEIFNHVAVLAPVIFTTAYDEYALHAFKVHSIAYLLKPCSYADFVAALEKLARQKALFATAHTDGNNEWQRTLQESFQETSATVRAMQKRYKARFMLHVGEKIVIVPTENVAYIEAEGKIVTLVTASGRRHIADQTLDELTELLDPQKFFRISRKFIIQASAIAEAAPYFNGRLTLKLIPPASGEVLVSRERLKDFKAWLEGA
jgi:DNA-binding LytR/AlgR family response regulator